MKIHTQPVDELTPEQKAERVSPAVTVEWEAERVNALIDFYFWGK